MRRTFLSASTMFLFFHFIANGLPLALATQIPFKDTLISDPASYVLPFIGTTGGGNVFPGATLPHGMIKVGMDTDSPQNQAGYDANPSYNATGFSQLHEDGTGANTPLSNFKVWPIAQCPSFELCPTSIDARKLSRKILGNGNPDDDASPGYFSTNLSNSVRVELTSTRRTALHRYTFPPGTKNPRILVDISDDGVMSGGDQVMTLDPDTAQVQGGASFVNSFAPPTGYSGRYRAYVCASFAGQNYTLGKPTEYGVWKENSPKKGAINLTGYSLKPGDAVGALLTFSPDPQGTETVILVRVGVSFISAQQACTNAQEEIPDFGFERVHKENRDQWNDLLSRVQVDPTGVPLEVVQLFYSSLYRSHISPADYSGENPRWNSSEPYYDSYYCNWDTFRTTYPLMSLHDPTRFAEIVRGMIDIQQHEGWLPECRSATLQQWVQGGSNGDPILGEFFVKYHDKAAALNVSQQLLYTALLADAEEQPPDWDLQGRQVDTWKSLGYIPLGQAYPIGWPTRQVSRTLEYAFDDFSISQVSKVLGIESDAQKYSLRAANWMNVWNPNTTISGVPGIQGMVQPRYANGTFGYADPEHNYPNDPFYEETPLTYSQFVPHDTAKLITLQGGTDRFIQRLDYIFDTGRFDATNEPSFQIPLMYHYANRSGLSTNRVRQVVSQFFNTSVNGLPGNDDSGAMGSYVVFLLSGLYPVPATRQYLVFSPSFGRISFYNPLLNTTTTIMATNFSHGTKTYVQNIIVNGQPNKSNCYIDWDVFASGGVVELTLSDDVNVSCGEALPPSLSTGGFD